MRTAYSPSAIALIGNVTRRDEVSLEINAAETSPRWSAWFAEGDSIQATIVAFSAGLAGD